MKKIGLLLVIMLCLGGCKAEETFETLSDVYGEQALAAKKEVVLTIPEDAAAQVIQSDSGTLYLCDGYEIAVQTMSAGDLNRTMQSLTGFEADALTVMETEQDEITRYECVWTAAGEGGDMVGRATVLDDGAYHYCVTVMAGAQEAGQLQQTWQTLLSSFVLG